MINNISVEDKAAFNILEGVYNVADYKEHFINTNNNGVLNEESLSYEKRQLLKKAISYLGDYLVQDIQHYPEQDISKVELSTDFVVIKTKDFKFLKKKYEEMLIDKYEAKDI